VAPSSVTLAELLPAGKAGKVVAGFFASSIEAAHLAKPDRWGVTMRKGYLRLNVGSSEAVTLVEDEIHVCALRNSVPAFVLEHPDCFLDEDERGPGVDFYKSTKGSILVVNDELKSRDLSRLLEALQQSHLQFVRLAATGNTNPMTKKSHTVLAVEELSRFVGRVLPQPKYAQSANVLNMKPSATA